MLISKERGKTKTKPNQLKSPDNFQTPTKFWLRILNFRFPPPPGKPKERPYMSITLVLKAHTGLSQSLVSYSSPQSLLQSFCSPFILSQLKDRNKFNLTYWKIRISASTRPSDIWIDISLLLVHSITGEIQHINISWSFKGPTYRCGGSSKKFTPR